MMNRFSALFASFVDFVFGLFGLLLGGRFIFRLFGANRANGFVDWLYDTTSPLIEPFENIFPTAQVGGVFVIEVSTLIALVVYGLAAVLIGTLLINLSKPLK